MPDLACVAHSVHSSLGSLAFGRPAVNTIHRQPVRRVGRGAVGRRTANAQDCDYVRRFDGSRVRRRADVAGLRADGAWPRRAGGRPQELHPDRKGCMRPPLGSALRSLASLGLRPVSLLVRTLLTITCDVPACPPSPRTGEAEESEKEVLASRRVSARASAPPARQIAGEIERPAERGGTR